MSVFLLINILLINKNANGKQEPGSVLTSKFELSWSKFG